MNHNIPTIFHVTHHKAGSQWVKAILNQCFRNRVVEAKLFEDQFLKDPIIKGKVYPTVYVTKEQFDSIKLPQNSKRFIVIRDLRDTLVSMYFSFKISHVFTSETPVMLETRKILNTLSMEEGLIYIMERFLDWEKTIQLSWIEAGENVIRYEDLLVKDTEIFTKLLIEDFRVPISRDRLTAIVISKRFKNVTGRNRGVERVDKHNRKGISGDWKNYFTDKVKEVFIEKYGTALIITGYETDLSW